jgi:hypothetical protein
MAGSAAELAEVIAVSEKSHSSIIQRNILKM